MDIPYTVYIRIFLRYVVGAGLMGSSEIGQMLATDPDAVFIVSAIIGAAVEAYYVFARRYGKET